MPNIPDIFWLTVDGGPKPMYKEQLRVPPWGLTDFILLHYSKHIDVHNMGIDTRKPVVGNLRTTQAQTSLRIRAV